MKKMLSVFLVAVLAICGTGLAGCAKRSEQLKLFSQGEYMDEDLFAEFENWYKETTGETVKVSIKDFNSNEDMYTKISKRKYDYDLICASDYMIEKMIAHELCQPLDKTIVDIGKAGLFRPEYLDATQLFDPDFLYSVPFMFGTMGMMYNYQKLGRHITGWAELFALNREETLYLKQAPRDTYAAASLYVARDQLAGVTKNTPEYKNAVQAVFDDVSADNVAAVKNVLNAWKGPKKNWDDEDGKFAMAKNEGAIGLFWSCDAGYVMNDFKDENGVDGKGNKNLWYVIPDEGGNIYLDSFILSKYAKNTKAANYFLQFLCTKDAAIRNSRYIGAISPVAAAYSELYEEYEAMSLTDESSFFYNATQEWKDMYIRMMFPTAEDLNRCGQMKDYGSSEQSILLAMADVIK